jgi:hypothetical protein
MPRRLHLSGSALLALLALFASACGGSANLVHAAPRAGQIALHGAYMPAMGEARMLMLEHCQGRFRAVERGHQLDFVCREDASPQAHAGAQIASAARVEPQR